MVADHTDVLLQVPQLHGTVLRAGDEEFPVCAETGAVYGPTVSNQNSIVATTTTTAGAAAGAAVFWQANGLSSGHVTGRSTTTAAAAVAAR